MIDGEDGIETGGFSQAHQAGGTRQIGKGVIAEMQREFHDTGLRQSRSATAAR